MLLLLYYTLKKTLKLGIVTVQKKGTNISPAAVSFFTSSKYFTNICQEADFPLWCSDSQGIVSILVNCLLWQHDLPERMASTFENPSLAELHLKLHFSVAHLKYMWKHVSIIPFFLTNWQVVHRGKNDQNFLLLMLRKEVESMPSWKELRFKIINTVSAGGEKIKVEMACTKETVLLSFQSSEVMKSTESCRAAPGTVNWE